MPVCYADGTICLYAEYGVTTLGIDVEHLVLNWNIDGSHQRALYNLQLP